MRTTDAGMLPGPGDLVRRPESRPVLTEAEAVAIRDRMLFGEVEEYLNKFVEYGDPYPAPESDSHVWPPRDEQEFCQQFAAFVVRELIEESK